ncbi:MAG TPA: serine hydrolase, partial [Noviherbaspirillum sp.]
MPTRRRFTTCALTLASAAAFPALHVGAADTEPSTASNKEEFFRKRMREIESVAQGRLGVQMLDTGSGRAYGYRADERFLMLSSFKLLASALVLQRADADLDTLERRIRYRKEDLVTWSPVTEKHVDGEGLSLAQLCEATITTSDNTAANLILASYGGPPAFTAFV